MGRREEKQKEEKRLRWGKNVIGGKRGEDEMREEKGNEERRGDKSR